LGNTINTGEYANGKNELFHSLKLMKTLEI